MNMSSTAPLKLAIAGLGGIGMTVARRINDGAVEGMTLAAVSARNKEKATARLAGFSPMPEICALEELGSLGDVIVECVPAAHFMEVAQPALEQGKIFMPLSVGVLLDHMELVDLARETGGRIIVPTGALIGLDAVRAAASCGITSAKLVTSKPPPSLADAPYVMENELSLEGLSEPKMLFSGTAREAAKGFPASLNVGAALALAGAGADETQVEIWADPEATRNSQSVTVTSGCAEFSMTIANVPTSENPRTGRITAHSVIAALQRLTSPLVIGS